MLARFLSGAKITSGIQYVGGVANGFGGNTSSQTVSLTSLSGGIASAPSAGDLVIVTHALASTADRDLIISTTGYTELNEGYVNSTFDTNLAISYKIMGGTPDTNVVITRSSITSADAQAVAIQVWRGVDQTSPILISLPTNSTSSANATISDDAFFANSSAIDSYWVFCAASAHNAGTQTYLRFFEGFTFASADFIADGLVTAGSNATNDVTVGMAYVFVESAYIGIEDVRAEFSTTSPAGSSSRAFVLTLQPA